MRAPRGMDSLGCIFIILINVAMKSFLDATGLRVKVDNNFGEIGISHE